MSLSIWIRSLFADKTKKARTKRSSLLRKYFDLLEDRLAPATLTWVGDIDSSWATNVAGNTNWSGNALPSNGDLLIFDGTSAGVLLNNTNAGSSYALSFTSGGYTIYGNSISLGHPGDDITSTTGSNSIGTDLIVEPSTVINVAGGKLTLTGAISGATGGLDQIGNGTLNVPGMGNYGGSTSIDHGTLQVDGIFSSAAAGIVHVAASATLAGSGTIGRPVDLEGVLSPGISGESGELTLQNSPLAMHSGSTFRANLSSMHGNTPLAAVDYDQVDVKNGQIALGGALELDLGSFTADTGASFTIINNESADAINGTFDGLANLTTFAVGGKTFQINYFGGDGNDVVLTVQSATAISPKVVSVTPNGNIPALAGAQRSMVASLQVVFDQPVQLDADALRLALHVGGVFLGASGQPSGYGVLPTNLNLSTVDAMTWVVTFSGNTDPSLPLFPPPADGFNSLQDGVYDLNVDASKVHPIGHAGVNGAANSSFVFYRLFGDVADEDSVVGNVHNTTVNTADNLELRTEFNTVSTASGTLYKPYLDFDGNGQINTTDNLQFRNRFNNPLSWALPSIPVITASLSDDTGPGASTNNDHLTSDSEIRGTVHGGASIVRLLARVDNVPSFTDVSADLQSDGSFDFDAVRLAQINRGFLTDGAHTIHLQAFDQFGGMSSVFDLTFNLDQTRPVAPTLDLSATSDTDTIGDHQTSASRVLLLGATEPGVSLTLVGPSVLTTISSNTGVFQFPDVALAPGANSFTVLAQDATGNVSSYSLTVTRTSATSQPNAVIAWNQAVIGAIQLDASDPPHASRALAMVQAAVYDAVNAIDGTPGYYVRIAAPAGASAEAAVDLAAYRVLSYLYPAQQANFDSLLAARLALVAVGQSRTDGMTVGQAAGNAIIALRAHDGYDTFVEYTPQMGAGQWQQTAPAYAEALDPQWANLTPFAMTSPSQFRPDGPPALSSQEWAAAFNEVKSLGSATSTTRTADQTQIARFWADGVGTWTPAGQWNAIAEQLAQQQGDSLAADARLFAMLDITMGDAAIVAWDAKYVDTAWRPITAIRNADEANNPLATADPNWTSLLVTPNFPEYISGHSTFSAAAATVLDSFFGSNVGFTSTSAGFTRSYASFDQAAIEAGRSRIYGGIHFEFSDADGEAAGRALASFIVQSFAVTTDTAAPRVTISSPMSGSVAAVNTTISGQVIDNLSGVQRLEAKLDGGNYFAVAFSVDGSFSLPTTFALNGAADGTHVFSFRATDAVGNVSTPLNLSFKLDTQAPTIAITAPTANANFADATTILAGSASGTGSTLAALSYRFDNGQFVPLSFDPATGSFGETLSLTRLAIGAHTLTLQAIDAAGNTSTSNVALTVTLNRPVTVADFSPGDGQSEVGVTFRPKVTFSAPILPASLNANNFFATDSTGAKLPATIVPADDGTYAWLFLVNPMPGASTISVTVDGSTIHSTTATSIDAAGTGATGSKLTFAFTTVNQSFVPGTTISGTLADPGPDLVPYSFDDARGGPDGVLMTGDDLYLLPIAHAKLYILGHEDQAIFTDANGHFTLTNVPVGDLKLGIDGRTATNAPANYFFPEMVMDLTIRPGIVNTVMGSMGTPQQQSASAPIRGVFLPRILSSVLQTVSSTQMTEITVNPQAAPGLTPQQQTQLKIDIAPGSLIGADGQRMTSGQVGISTVPPSMVMDMLPPGLLQHTFDITIQAPGVATFTTPAQLTFPNLFNAAPGTKLDLLSFDHTTGRLEIDGTATVSADGQSVTTDPGNGVTHPGWHGLTPPGDTLKEPEIEAATPPVDTAGSFCALLAPDFQFDFGTSTSPVAPGYAPITPQSVYNSSIGFGWQLEAGQSVQASDSGIASAGDLNGSFNATNNGTFAVDVPDGLYGVTVTLGDATARHGEMGVYVHGVLVADITTAPGQFTKSLYIMSSTGGQLALTFKSLDGAGDEVAVNAMEIERLSDAPRASVAPQPTLDGQRFYYAFQNIETGYVIRGSATSLSALDNQLFLAPNSRYVQYFFDPSTFSTARAAFTTSTSGNIIEAPTLVFNPPRQGDFSDVVLGAGEPPLSGTTPSGLTADMAFILGTDPTKFSTANDGISDLAKVQQGLALFGNYPLPTGVVATLPLQGVAKSITLQGSTLSSQGQTAYVATGGYGLAIVNASQFQNPLVLGEIQLAGDSTDVAVDDGLNIAVVAANSGGIDFVDVSNSQSPVLKQTLSVDAGQVEVLDGIAYVATGSEVRSYDMLTYDRIQALSLGNDPIASMARDGSFLYTIDTNRVLSVVDLTTGTMFVRGTLSLPSFGGKLVVGNGVAYIGVATGGFMTVNVNDPDNLSLLSGVDAPNLEGSGIAVNGSGLAVTVGSLAIPGSPFLIQLIDVADPTNTSAFVTQFPLSTVPFDVAIGGGIAFIADGSDGLSVVNYLSFDHQGLAPTAQLSVSSGIDINPAQPGVQVQEGSIIPIQVSVADDVQVRNVELLVNGQVQENRISFPFDLSAALPTLSQVSSPLVTLQVRATDTGGNVTLSAPVTVEIVPDTFAPVLTNSNIPDQSVRGTGFRAITLDFSESLDPSSVTAASIHLVGPNGPVTLTNIQFRRRNAIVQVTVPALDLGNYLFTINAAAVKDVAGNPLGTANILRNFRIANYSSVWISTAGGYWDEPTNWDTGVVPGPTDDVLIDVPGNVAVTYRSGSTDIRSLTSNTALILSGGLLRVSQTVQINNSFQLAGGALAEARILPGSNGQKLNGTSSGGLLDGVTLNADMDLASSSANVTVVNGLTLNGTLTLSNSFTRVSLSGTQTLAGVGSVVFASSSISGLIVSANNTTLTIGAGITVRGGSGTNNSNGAVIGYSGYFGGGANASVINLGTISADAAGQFIWVNTTGTLTNQGTLKAKNGGLLNVNNVQGNLGTVSVLSGSELDLDGAYTVNQAIAFTDAALTLGGAWTNAASATISATGGVLSLGSGSANWTNTAGISVSNTTVNLGGTFSLADLGTFTRTGGTVNFTGNLINDNTTLALNASTGSWYLAGGAIYNGIVTGADGQKLIGTSSGGLLDGVTLNADMDLASTGANVTVVNGLTLNGTLTLSNSFTRVSLSGTQTLAGVGSVVFASSSISGLIVSADNTTLTIGAGITVRGGSGTNNSNGAVIGSGSYFGGGSNANVINLGTISADAAGQFIWVNTTGTLTNQGTLEAKNGGLLHVNNVQGNLGTISVLSGSELDLDGAYTVNQSIAFTDAALTLGGAWTNTASATISATGGVLSLGSGSANWTNTAGISVSDTTVNLGGTFSLADLGTFTRTGGTVNFTGNLINDNTTLALNASTGSWYLAGGAIYNGIVTGADGQKLIGTSSGGLLDGVTLNADMDLASTGANVTVVNGLTLNGTLTLSNSFTRVSLSGTQTLGGSGSVVFANSIYSGLIVSADNTTLTIGAGITVRGGSGTNNSNGAVIGSGSYFGGGSNANVINLGTISADAAGQFIWVNTTGTLTNQGTLEAKNGGLLHVNNVQGNLGTISVLSGSELDLDGAYTVNQSIAFTDAALTLGGAWTNTASATISATGGVLSLGSGSANWTNTAGISVSNTTVNLGGTFSLADLGTFTRTGGVVYFTGNLINDNTTLALNASTGSWYLAGGAIYNGIVTGADGQKLIGTSSGGLLDGVTLNADMDLASTGANVTVVNGLTLNGTLTLSNSFTRVSLSGTQTLGGSGSVVFANSIYSGLIVSADNTTLTIGAGITVRGGSGTNNSNGAVIGSGSYFGGGSNANVINLGTISADAAGQFIWVNTTGTLTNQGTLEAKNGGLLHVNNVQGNLGTISVLSGSELDLDGAYTVNQSIAFTDAALTLGGAWTNTASATISATGGVLSLGSGSANWTNTAGISVSDTTVNLGGTFSLADLGTFTRTGGTVNFTGNLINDNTTLALNASTGSWYLAGGAIYNGIVTGADGQKLIGTSSGGLLDGVTLNADMDLASTGANVTVVNGLTLNGTLTLSNSFTRVSLSGTQTLGGSGSVVFANSIYSGLIVSADNTTLTIGAGITVRGGSGTNNSNGAVIGSGSYFGGGSNANVINLGTISADAAGQFIWVNTTGTLTNQGTLEAKNGGLLSVGNFGLNAGTVVARVGSTVAIAGSYSQDASAIMAIDIGGTDSSQFGTISVSNSVSLDGTIRASFVNGFVPAAGNSFRVLTFLSRTGTFSAISSLNLPMGVDLLAAYDPFDVTLAII